MSCELLVAVVVDGVLLLIHQVET
jgi:hypothetical protein